MFASNGSRECGPGGLPSLARSPRGAEKREQVGELLLREHLAETGGHERDIAGLDVRNRAAGDPRLLAGDVRQHDLVAFVQALYARRGVSGRRANHHWLVAAGEARENRMG